MALFSATVDSTADVSAPVSAVWQALTDPDLLPRLTPLLSRIDADGDVASGSATWRWHMARIAALGVSVIPTFTEAMKFTEPSRIEYTHAPPKGSHERAGADGVYDLSEIDGGTHLAISLTLQVELPLPRAAAPAVEKVMQATMTRTGDKFAANLLEHLHAHEL